MVVENLGPHDETARFDHPPGGSLSSYDHPFFGQIILAGILSSLGYPNSLSLSPNGDLHSIEMLYLVPRVVMGIFAILDTFLIYKIAERRYGRKVALISSIIFAVMPLTWLLRWILLDSILLPFLLSSILLAIPKKNPEDMDYKVQNNERRSNINIPILLSGIDYKVQIIERRSYINIPILLSGILLGLAIYTKIPAFTMIPLVGYLLYNNTKNMKTVALWIIPVILIPLMWPVYSIANGQFGEWIDGVLWQGTQRHTGIRPDIKIEQFFKSDPVLLILGVLGISIATIKRDFMPLLWIFPYLTFLYFVGWTILFHWVIVLPVFCISTAILIRHIAQWITKKRTKQNLLILGSTLVIAIFGLTTITMLISINLSSSEFEAAAFVLQNLQVTNHLDSGETKPGDNVTIITSPIYSWIYTYIFDKNQTTSHIRDSSPIRTDKFMMMEDGVYQSFLSKEDQEDTDQYQRIKTIHIITRGLATFDENDNYFRTIKNAYPFGNLIAYSWAKEIEVRANY